MKLIDQGIEINDSRSGVILGNMRGLSYSFTAGTMVLPFLGLDAFGLIMGAVLAGYYGYKMENQIHNLRNPWWKDLQSKIDLRIGS